MTESQAKNQLAGYFSAAAQSDVLDSTSLTPTLLGLAGEIGDAVSAAKKMIRDSIPGTVYRSACIEELGDVLWYLAAAARRLNVDPHELSGIKLAAEYPAAPETVDRINLECASGPEERPLLDLVFRAGQFCNPENTLVDSKAALNELSAAYFRTIQSLNLNIADIAQTNLNKIRDYFGPPDWNTLPELDQSPLDERIPQHLEVKFIKRSSGKTHIMISDVFVGDPLDDNNSDLDYYRLHDVFHLANAFVLGWSPVIRALLKRKRKSNPTIDSTEDSGRAIVSEEAIVSYIFAQAKRYQWFANRDRIPLDILKIVRVLSTGYEGEKVPLWAWSNCFLQGFRAFLSLKECDGTGTLICNGTDRKITFRG